MDEKEVDVNAKSNESNAPLHFATQTGRLDIVKYLIDKEIYANIRITAVILL
ncbi:ankyrin repeat domain-containing protein [Wolbachia endosymbiont of Brugia malayi]|uniref:ankyrin repeat domain-containing protein n=1 Tax=Wolbachia endosymbiont of Brugia malayi TaxID=80849 RepID=UPI00397BE3AD